MDLISAGMSYRVIQPERERERERELERERESLLRSILAKQILQSHCYITFTAGFHFVVDF
jgi:hypothetical protein